MQTSYQQTVLAGFLIEDLTQETLTCVALGVGTKYLSHSVIETDPESKRIRDSHAEILAKRNKPTESTVSIISTEYIHTIVHTMWQPLPLGMLPANEMESGFIKRNGIRDKSYIPVL